MASPVDNIGHKGRKVYGAGLDLTRMIAGASGSCAAVSNPSQAEEVFGDRECAIGWLNEPQFALAHHPPREFLSTELGRRQVTELLIASKRFP
jgi:hypothetical protein